jgi:hypothetical protein
MSLQEWFGDLLLAILDEIKFWIEVIQAFMEWDEQNHQQWIQRQLDQVTKEMGT